MDGKNNEQENENKSINEALPSQEEDLHKEIKNANASGLGSLGRSDDTIEKTDEERKEENKEKY